MAGTASRTIPTRSPRFEYVSFPGDRVPGPPRLGKIGAEQRKNKPTLNTKLRILPCGVFAFSVVIRHGIYS